MIQKNLQLGRFIAMMLVLVSSYSNAGEAVGSKPSQNLPSDRSYFDMSEQELLKIAQDSSKQFGCSQFVSKTGELESGGKSVYEAIEKSKDLKVLIEPQIAKPQWLKICPGLVKMSASQKKSFWVWTLAVTGRLETDCGRVKQINSRPDYFEPVSLLGLVKGGFGKPCIDALKTEAADVTCTLSIHRSKALASESGKTPFGNQSHPRYRAAIRHFPLCEATPGRTW